MKKQTDLQRLDAVIKRNEIQRATESDPMRYRITNMLTRLMPMINSLYARWLDEYKYEDIKDYQKVFQSKMPKDFRITKMTKRPFGFEFKIYRMDGARYRMMIKRNRIICVRVS